MKSFYLAVGLFFLHTFCFGQDIVITGISGGQTFEQYAAVAVNVTLKNEGIVATASFSVRGALSSDNILDDNDHDLYAYSYISLAAGESKTIELKSFSSPGAPVGNYNLIIKADEYSSIAETNEANNISVTSGYSVVAGNVDLVFQSCTLDNSTISSHNEINGYYTVNNIGTTSLFQRVWTTFLLSTDAVQSGDDINLEVWGSHPDANTFTSAVSLKIPGVAPGNYYILGVTDYFSGLNEHINETDETNNLVAVPLTITAPDIDLELLQFHDLQNQDGNIFFSMTLRNNGTTPVVIDGEDFTLLADGMPLPGYLSIYDQTIGPSETVYFSYVSLYTYLPGPVNEYTLHVNQSHAITEVNYNNNSLTLGSVPPPKNPIVNLTAASWSGTYNEADRELLVNATFANTGDSYYVHESVTLQIKNSQAQVVHTNYDFFIDSYFQNGTTRIHPYTLHLASALPAGNYTLSITTYTNSISIPLTIQPATIHLSGTIQDDTGTPITNGKLFLYQKKADGTVQFINQVENSSTNDFSFQLDQRNYTLYFIPDRTAFPDHLPTVFGKTLMLEESSFFHLSDDSTVVMEVLKVTPPTGGSGIISGTINGGSSGSRMSALAQSFVVIILLDAAGNPVAITNTDETGYFIFENLAPGEYQLAVTTDVNQPFTLEPYPVDISTTNARVELTLSGDELSGSTERVLYEQVIDFEAIDEKTFGDDQFNLVAASSAELPLTYSSSNTDIAVISGTQVSILRAGTVTITAHQQGNESYQSVEATQELIIHKANQTIDFDAITDKNSHEVSFGLIASASSELEVSFESDNTNVISITGSTASIVGAGEVTITAKQTGSENFEAAEPKTQTFTVNLVLGTEKTLSNDLVYPNPTPDFIRISSDYTITAVSLIHTSGRKEVIELHENQINLQHLPAGAYILTFKEGEVARQLNVIKK